MFPTGAARPRRRGDRMRRRDFTAGLLLAAAARPVLAQQPAKRHRIAILHPAIPAARIAEDYFWRAFIAELRGSEGENLVVEPYSAEGHHEHYADLAREIAARQPDAI